MKWVALRADSEKMIPSLAMTPTACPQMRPNPQTIDGPHSGLNAENREPSSSLARISEAAKGTRAWLRSAVSRLWCLLAAKIVVEPL